VDPVIAKGTCFPLFAYEVAYAIDLDEAERRVVAGTERQTVKFKRRAPAYFEYRPAPLRVARDAESLDIAGYRAALQAAGIDEDPSLVVTGNRDVKAAAQALSSGVFAFVPKPFDFKQLDHLVALAVATQRPAAGDQPAS